MISKTIYIPAPVLILMSSLAVADRVEEKNDWTERYEVSSESPTLEIENIWGDVKVLPGPEGEITLSIMEHRSAPEQELFERSLEIFPLEIKQEGDGVFARVGHHKERWWQGNECHRCRVDVQFEAHVPPGTRVFAGTVNDGRVEISDIAGRVNADNVNGPVAVHNAISCESVESVNGKVTLSFAAAPGTDCSIETINGDINITLPDGAGLDVAVDLGNGRITSELPVDPVAIPARVEHRESGGSHTYTIEQAAGLRLAGGGPRLSVSSLNGDLRIYKTK